MFTQIYTFTSYCFNVTKIIETSNWRGIWWGLEYDGNLYNKRWKKLGGYENDDCEREAERKEASACLPEIAQPLTPTPTQSRMMACVDDMLGISARARRQPASTPKPVKQMDVLCGYSVPLIPYTRRLSICRYEIKKNVYLWKKCFNLWKWSSTYVTLKRYAMSTHFTARVNATIEDHRVKVISLVYM